MKKTKTQAKNSTRFYRRLYRNILITFIVIFLSLLMGVLGYHFIAHLSFVDALLNASMIRIEVATPMNRNSNVPMLMAIAVREFA